MRAQAKPRWVSYRALSLVCGACGATLGPLNCGFNGTVQSNEIDTVWRATLSEHVDGCSAAHAAMNGEGEQ